VRGWFAAMKSFTFIPAGSMPMGKQGDGDAAVSAAEFDSVFFQGACMSDRQVMEHLPYAVVVNDEEQYSIWPTDKPVPNGWRMAGKTGSKEDCLQYVNDVWVDMRPLSLRKNMSADSATARIASAATQG
jgi:MbtH protein